MLYFVGHEILDGEIMCSNVLINQNTVYIVINSLNSNKWFYLGIQQTCNNCITQRLSKCDNFIYLFFLKRPSCSTTFLDKCNGDSHAFEKRVHMHVAKGIFVQGKLIWVWGINYSVYNSYMYSLFSTDIPWAVIRISSRKLIWIELISKWKKYLNNLLGKHTQY